MDEASRRGGGGGTMGSAMGGGTSGARSGVADGRSAVRIDVDVCALPQEHNVLCFLLALGGVSIASLVIDLTRGA